MKNQEYDYLYKVILVGNFGVGKSELIFNYVDQVKCQIPSIPLQFQTKIVQHQGKTIKLLFLDTATRQKIGKLPPSFYKQANAMLLVYDITSKQSFQSIELWWKQALEVLNPSCIIKLVGNKLDLENQRQVEKKEGEQLDCKLKVSFCEVAGKVKKNIDELFQPLVVELLERFPQRKQLKKEKKGKRNCF